MKKRNTLKKVMLNKEKIKKHIVPIVILTILISRLLLSLVFGNNSLGDDGPRYLATAKNVLNYHVFSYETTPNPAPSSHDTPVFIFLEAIILAITGNDYVTFIVISSLNALFFTFATYGLYLLTKKVFRSRRVALFSSMAFAVMPQTITYSILMVPESLFMALFIWSYYFLFQFISEKKWSFLIYSFSLLGISVITKPIALLFAPVSIAIIIFSERKSPIKKILMWIIVGLTVEMLMVSPWLMRNYATFKILSLSTVMNENLFYYNYKIMLGDKIGIFPASEEIAQIELRLAKQYGPQWQNPFIQSGVLGSYAKKEILKNLPQYTITTLKHQPRLYMGTGAIQFLELLGDSNGKAIFKSWLENPNFSSFIKLPKYIVFLQIISWFIVMLFYILFLCGFILLLKTKNFFPAILFGIVVLYFDILIGPVLSTRYTLPILLFASPFVAIALDKLLQKKLKKL